MDNAIKEVVECIKNSSECKDCLKIKKQMNENEELKEKVSKIKELQKSYLRTLDSNYKEKLDVLEKELNDIPLYSVYNQKLELVNEKINYVVDEVNEYFYNLLNGER